MKCEKCGKEIPEGENKICDDCKKDLLKEIENVENKSSEKETVKETVSEKTNPEDNSKKECCKGVKKSYLIFGIFIAVIVLLSIIQIKFNTFDSVFDIVSENKVGNNIANIRNYGYVTTQGSYMYYVAPTPNGTNMAVYRSKKDGSSSKMLVSDNWEILGLNVKGDYVYFIALSEEANESGATLESNESVDTLNNKIYRMKTNGEDLEVINDNEFHNNCYEIYVVEDKVFYIGLDQNVWYMGLDGSNKTKLNNDETGYLGVTDKYIVLNLKKENPTIDEEQSSTELSQNTALYSYETCLMDLNGKNIKKLTGERIYSINIHGDTIYYVNDNKSVYRINIDGTDNTLISDSVKAYNMNVGNDYIYYMNYTDEKQEDVAIYRMNLDGSDNKEIFRLDQYSTFLNVVGNNVIFMDNSDIEATINMIDSEGKNRKRLYSYTKDTTPMEDYENIENTNNVEPEQEVKNEEIVEESVENQ